jgi:hypothetical protein
MSKGTRFFGLDVHKDRIAVAVAEPSGDVRSLGTIPNEATDQSDFFFFTSGLLPYVTFVNRAGTAIDNPFK